MPYDRELHHRRSIRLRGYDYTAAGMYFVTICVQDRACLLGNIVDGKMRLSTFGQVADRCWQAIPHHFADVSLDAHVVMPNHVHGIIVIQGSAAANRASASPAEVPSAADAHVGAQHAAPLHAPQQGSRAQPSQANGPRHTLPTGVAPRSLGAIVRAFKAAVTREVNGIRDAPGAPLWQRNFWEHIIRNADEYERIYTYVISNPGLWREDVLYALGEEGLSLE